MKIIGYTPRFYLRETTVDDAAFWHELNKDPEVVKYTGDVPFESVASARKFLLDYDHYKRYNRGRWSIIDRTTEESMGWCGLKYHEEGDYTDLGYRLPQAHWGKGIATETSHLSMMYGFQRLGLETIVGHAMPDNPASLRVLEKMGMSGDRVFEEDGFMLRELSVSKYDYYLHEVEQDGFELVE